MTYQWLRDGVPVSGANASIYIISNVQLSDQGSYSVQIVNSGGMTTSGSVPLTVPGVAPSVSSDPQSESLVRGATASFSVTASGTYPLTYQWTFNGANISGATSSSLSLSQIGTNNAGSYAVVVKNSPGTKTSAVATLTIILPPTITTQPASQSAGIGKSVTFGVAGSNASGYQWNFNGTPLAGATSSTFSLNGVQTNNTGNYSVVLTNVAGATTSSVAALTVMAPFNLAPASSGSSVSSNGYSFQFSAPAGRTYVVLASSDFSTWVPIATNVTGSGSVSFTDPTAANFRNRLYRVSVQ